MIDWSVVVVVTPQYLVGLHQYAWKFLSWNMLTPKQFLQHTRQTLVNTEVVYENVIQRISQFTYVQLVYVPILICDRISDRDKTLLYMITTSSEQLYI